jgi:hypothetical protein
MKKLTAVTLILVFLFSQCDIITGKRVEGSGNVITESRDISDAKKIRLTASYEVELAQGDQANVKVMADDNIIPYIVTEERGDWLVISSKDNVNLHTSEKIRVMVTIPELENIDLSGSGRITTRDKFTAGRELKIDLSGSGTVNAEINTPKIRTAIAGSGKINLKGETKNLFVDIAGSGDLKADELLSETTELTISGSGNARVFADVSLKANIAGSGDVYYKGRANVSTNIAGSGKVRMIE